VGSVPAVRRPLLARLRPPSGLVAGAFATTAGCRLTSACSERGMDKVVLRIRGQRVADARRYAHVKGIALLFMMSLVACSHANPYAATEADVLAASHDWVPEGKDENYTLSATETERRNNDVASCVSELSDWL